ncbi:hypothetical protein F8M41_008270 [Gigaspora margarita]|uniref:Uncharacterized protein n=1 Tax=Gigaspora margarita TaxID=4874 RepID=A0A8H3X6F0_GIGMA|nr:hypothetical protein F8M41_008270 [Gigaspora margarita]
MAQQVQVSAPQIVEPVRQPRGSPLSLQSEEDLKNYYVTKFLKDLQNQILHVTIPKFHLHGPNTCLSLDNEEDNNSGYDEENNRWAGTNKFEEVNNATINVLGILDLNKNQFRMKLHGMTYTIPTFSKIAEINDLPKEEQNQASTDSSSLTSEKDLKKSMKILKSAS